MEVEKKNYQLAQTSEVVEPYFKMVLFWTPQWPCLKYVQFNEIEIIFYCHKMFECELLCAKQNQAWCSPTMFSCFWYTGIFCCIILYLCCGKHLYLSVLKLIDYSVLLAVSCCHKLLFDYILIPWKTLNISLYKRQFTQFSIFNFFNFL